MRYSKIIPASLAITVLSVLSAAAQQAPPRLAYVQPLSLQSVQSVQEKLREAGVYSGRIDGIWGADSETALQNSSVSASSM